MAAPRNKTITVVLAVLGGTLGLHRFYLFLLEDLDEVHGFHFHDHDRAALKAADPAVRSATAAGQRIEEPGIIASLLPEGTTGRSC